MGFIRGPACGSPNINNHEARGQQTSRRWAGALARRGHRQLHTHAPAVRSAGRRSGARPARSCAAQGAQRLLALLAPAQAAQHRTRKSHRQLRKSAGTATGSRRSGGGALVVHQAGVRAPAVGHCLRARCRPARAARIRRSLCALSRAQSCTLNAPHVPEARVCVVCFLCCGRPPQASRACLFHVKHWPRRPSSRHRVCQVGRGGLPSCGGSHHRAASRPAGVGRSRSRCAGVLRGGSAKCRRRRRGGARRLRGLRW